MPSKVVTDHQQVTETVAAAIRTHGRAIATGVREVVAAETPERPVDVQPLLDHLLAAMDRRLTALLIADNAHVAELNDDHAPRFARDAAVASLYRAVVDLKRAAVDLFGEPWARQLSFPAEVPTESAMLERAATQVVKGLGEHGLPPSVIPGIPAVDPGAWIALLNRSLSDLSRAREVLHHEAQEARATRTARDTALAALVSATVDANQIVQGLARLAKTPALVEGLRGTLDRSSTAARRAAPEPTPDAEPASDA